MKSKTYYSKNNKGFTLVELMTSVTVFLVVMTISMGSIVSVLDANRKSESLKTVMDNLNFALESMSRDIRFGKNYHCDPSGNITLPQDCTGGNSYLSFLSSDNTQIVYKLTGTQIEKSSDGGSSFTAITAPEINIQNFNFYVYGAPALDERQPKVVIKIQGRAGIKLNTSSDFTVQTLVSQRFLDS